MERKINDSCVQNWYNKALCLGAVAFLCAGGIIACATNPERHAAIRTSPTTQPTATLNLNAYPGVIEIEEQPGGSPAFKNFHHASGKNAENIPQWARVLVACIEYEPGSGAAPSSHEIWYAVKTVEGFPGVFDGEFTAANNFVNGQPGSTGPAYDHERLQACNDSPDQNLPDPYHPVGDTPFKPNIITFVLHDATEGWRIETLLGDERAA